MDRRAEDGVSIARVEEREQHVGGVNRSRPPSRCAEGNWLRLLSGRDDGVHGAEVSNSRASPRTGPFDVLIALRVIVDASPEAFRPMRQAHTRR